MHIFLIILFPDYDKGINFAFLLCSGTKPDLIVVKIDQKTHWYSV